MLTKMRYKIALYLRKKGNREDELEPALRYYDLANWFLPSARKMREYGLNWGADLRALEN